ncbi:NADH pyrophosphatase [compost metagenome]
MYVAAYLVLIQNDQILLLRRFNTGYQDGKYSLVAGHLDGGETVEECIIREAKEEADIDLSQEGLQVKHIMHRKASDREYMDVYLVATMWNGNVQNMEPHKCDDLSWFPLSALPENLIAEVRFALEKIQQGIFFSEVGW